MSDLPNGVAGGLVEEIRVLRAILNEWVNYPFTMATHLEMDEATGNLQKRTIDLLDSPSLVLVERAPTEELND